DRYLDTMREDIGELNALIGRILILSKLDMHKASQKSEYLHLSGMINELLEKLKPFIDHKHLHIITDLSVDPPVFGNKDSLRMALSNILDNAVKFTPENGEIYVEMHQEQNDLKISVTNSSIPLSEEDLEKIFEPFYRIDQSPPSGSGLGLAIAKKIIENHHGCIEASNTEGGIKILICLPTCSSE
ncbi:MAG: HAMP domain-containing sensor histidine kinase, partial [Thermodesulfobacteriota bacterium]|nr:HAMP domain-containing sensor histidine kinase [Thermodesulfobacteriota bacterium]